MVSRESLVGWFLHDGYLWDWLAAAILIIINLVVPSAIGPIDRFITPGDPSLSYPYKTNTISSSVLYVLTFVFPGVVFVAWAVLKRSFAEGHHALLSLAEACALGTLWKRWMNLVGRLRPNWFATLAAYGEGSAQAEDARLSYPSGHTTYMFFSATLLACWLMGKMKVMADPSQGLFIKLLVCLMPLWLATFVACTRITDYKHDFSDVNAGCFIGIAAGMMAYFLNYPSLFSPQCHQPKLRSRVSALSTGDVRNTRNSYSQQSEERSLNMTESCCQQA